ncbi:MAG: hypothetical protein EXR75_01210 [Myxococcales bacterium]|nr:hypothetical protein [Myxococcales bacterium]
MTRDANNVDVCTNTQFDPANCGACGKACGIQQACVAGSCTPLASAVTAIAAGGLHTCALLNDDTVKCWGRNHYGQLGLGDVQWRGDGPNETGDFLKAVLLTGP